MRGEDQGMHDVNGDLRGSPPHARGRRQSTRIRVGERRITPACAGKTRRDGFGDQKVWDHPRMRGEDLNATVGGGFLMGSPPHARGRLQCVSNKERKYGITPACAGKTLPLCAVQVAEADHPRMRGEDSWRPFACLLSVGSPPHARGRPLPSTPTDDT